MEIPGQENGDFIFEVPSQVITWNMHLEKTERLYSQAHYDSVLTTFESKLIAPAIPTGKRVAGHQYVALSKLHLGNSLLAAAQFDNLLEIDPTYKLSKELAESSVMLADEYYRGRKFQQLEQGYQVLLDKEVIPDNFITPIKMHVAFALAELDHMKRARAYFKEIIKNNPKFTLPRGDYVGNKVRTAYAEAAKPSKFPWLLMGLGTAVALGGGGYAILRPMSDTPAPPGGPDKLPNPPGAPD